MKKFLLCNEPFFKLIFSENEINNYQKEILNKLNIEDFFIKNDQNDNELVITHKEFVKLYNEYDSYFKNKTILLTLLIEIEVGIISDKPLLKTSSISDLIFKIITLIHQDLKKSEYLEQVNKYAHEFILINSLVEKKNLKHVKKKI